MQVTGYKILGSLRAKSVRRAALYEEFSESLTRFPEDDDKRDPATVMQEISSLEEDIAELEALQVRHNDSVLLHSLKDGKPVVQTLGYAIKLVGGLERMANACKQASLESKRGTHHYFPAIRRAEDIVAKPVLSRKQITQMTIDVLSRLAEVKGMIASGNGEEVLWSDDRAIRLLDE